MPLRRPPAGAAPRRFGSPPRSCRRRTGVSGFARAHGKRPRASCFAPPFILAGTSRVRQVHQHQVTLVRHQVLARRLFVGCVLREGQVLARHLLLLRARGDIPEARRAVLAGGDEGASVAELDLRDRAAARCANVSVRKCPHTTGLLQLQYVVVFCNVVWCVAAKMSP